MELAQSWRGVITNTHTNKALLKVKSTENQYTRGGTVLNMLHCTRQLNDLPLISSSANVLPNVLCIPCHSCYADVDKDQNTEQCCTYCISHEHKQVLWRLQAIYSVVVFGGKCLKVTPVSSFFFGGRTTLASWL